MTTALSKRKLAGLLLEGGFTEQQVPAMLEIAKRESSLNPLALNPNADTGDLSYGLFQINMLGGMGPERRKALGLKSNEELYDPVTNVRAAKYIYDMQGPGAWSVYNPKDPAFTNLNFNDSNKQENIYNISVEAPKKEPKKKTDPFEQMLLGQLFRGLDTNPAATASPFQGMLKKITEENAADLIYQYQQGGYGRFY